MRRELAGKRVILTGATGGMGRAIAAALTKAGARVALSGRNAEKLDQLVSDLKPAGDVVAVVSDIGVPADRERLVDTAVAAFGGLDILINNAGIGSFGHFATSTEAINREVLEVDFFAPVELVRLAVPHLMRGVQPAVVNNTSMCGRRGMPAWPEYSAAKFALVGMSEALRAEFARFDIDVLTILPGLTNSGYNNNLIRNDGKMNIRYDKGMSPEYVADGMLDAIRRNRRETVLGSEAKWMLRANRFFPRLTNWLIARKVKKLYATP